MLDSIGNERLAVIYVGICMVRAIYWTLLTGTVQRLAEALVPLPGQWLPDPIHGSPLGPWPAAGFAVLSAAQLALLGIGAMRIRAAWPGVLAPSSAPAPETAVVGPVDGRSLRRPWWRTPLIMTVVLVLFVHGVTVWLGSAMTRWPVSAEWILAQSFPWPLLVAGILALLGMAAGSAFNSAAQERVGGMAGVRYLPAEHPLTRRVHAMAARLDLPPPRVGVTDAVNAYACGPSIDKAAVVIGTPLVAHMAPDELDAVIGHELGHVVTGDMRQMQYAIGYQSMFGQVFSVLVAIVVNVAMSYSRTRSGAMLTAVAGDLANRLGRYILFVFGELIVQHLSRSREYHADAVGAALTSPDAMARALTRIETMPATPTPAEQRYAYLMFRNGRLGRLFSTHPTFEQRRKALADGRYVRALPRRRV